jgi:hypothetical protein
MYLCFGKKDFTNVVFPDCLGPVTEMTGYLPANLNSESDKFLGIILCNFAFVSQIYIKVLFCQELFVFHNSCFSSENNNSVNALCNKLDYIWWITLFQKMKLNIPVAIISFLLSINFALSGQTINNKQNSSQFFPLKLGNYWVYSYSNHPGKIDTIKITKNKILGLDTAYYYNSYLWFERNDTVYEFQSQRSGYSFPTIQFFPSEKETEFGAMMGGEQLIPRTVEKLEGSYKVNGKDFYNCYIFKTKSENGFYYDIISRGIGLIESGGNGRHVSLIDYKVE